MSEYKRAKGKGSQEAEQRSHSQVWSDRAVVNANCLLENRRDEQ